MQRSKLTGRWSLGRRDKLMLKNAAAIAIISASFALGLGLSSAPSADDKKDTTQDSIYKKLDLLAAILERVQRDYVDEVDNEAVIEAAIQGMLRSLDPHSTYLNPESFEQVRVQMEGEYGGLGIEVQMEGGYVKVVSPIDDTPAAQADIQGGDYITHIDKNPVLGKTLNEAVSEMRGEVGQPIIITIVREGVEPFDVELVRDKIMVRSVRHRIEDDSIGYIRVSTFNVKSGSGVEEAIVDLKAQLGDRMEGLILDLRNNPGGFLDQAIRISDAFLDRGEIVSTRGRKPRNNSRWFATQGDLAEGLPVVVLVNGSSASASEIVAGALQDHRRAVVVGDKTFGKGTVQSEMRLGREGEHALRLTTARYFTPSGRSIQERGVEPDIYRPFPRPKGWRQRREADLNNVIANDQALEDRAGEMPTEAEEEVFMEITYGEDGRPLPPEQDIQLQYAIKLIKGLGRIPEPQIATATPANTISADKQGR